MAYGHIDRATVVKPLVFRRGSHVHYHQTLLVRGQAICRFLRISGSIS